MPGFLRWH
jgi:hypothetical protein